MNRYPNGDFVVVSGGPMSVTHPSFGLDLSHDEAIQRIKDLMFSNTSLQGKFIHLVQATLWNVLTLKVPVATIDALEHFETG